MTNVDLDAQACNRLFAILPRQKFRGEIANCNSKTLSAKRQRQDTSACVNGIKLNYLLSEKTSIKPTHRATFMVAAARAHFVLKYMPSSRRSRLFSGHIMFRCQANRIHRIISIRWSAPSDDGNTHYILSTHVDLSRPYNTNHKFRLWHRNHSSQHSSASMPERAVQHQRQWDQEGEPPNILAIRKYQIDV